MGDMTAPAIDIANPRDLARDLGWAPKPAWQALLYFSAYRVLLAGLLISLVILGASPRVLGGLDFGLFTLVCGAYFGFGVLTAAASYWQWPRFRVQIVTQVVVDILALTILMHASGGVTSGFGLLLVVAIAGGSILTEGRIAILFAAVASIAVLGQQLYLWHLNPWTFTNYPHAGMLGAAFFATAYIAYISARRIRTSEALAARREVDLANLAQLNEHIIQRMQSGIVIVDADERVRMVNRSAERLLGLTGPSEGRTLRVLAPELDSLLCRWQDDMGQSTYMMEAAAARLTLQSSFAALGPAASQGTLVFLEDASAMNQRAQELKLASLGRLAGSIAHEIRNPLSAVSHANQLLGESENLDRGDQRLLRIIRDNAERMNTIVENVLQLGRGKAAVPQKFELGPWMEAFVAEFIANSSAQADQLRVSLSQDLREVRFDPSQLHQVVWNLCENGLRHAGSPPLLEVRAGVALETHRPYLEIVDNGDGISASMREQVFEPFFTTRVDGTGLGLYVARELCEGNQASLTLLNNNSGCCFRITFADPRRRGALQA